MKLPTAPATVTVACAALLLAGVAGTATAGNGGHPTIRKNSVTSSHIKNGTVQEKDLSAAVRAALAPTPPTPVPPTAPYTPPLVFAAAPEGSVNIPFDADTEVVAQSLPAGRYAVQANLTLYSTQSGIGSCALLVDSDSYNGAQHTFPAGGGRTSISLSAVLVASPEKSPSVECWTPATGNASEIRLTALQVRP